MRKLLLILSEKWQCTILSNTPWNIYLLSEKINLIFSMYVILKIILTVNYINDLMTQGLTLGKEFTSLEMRHFQ